MNSNLLGDYGEIIASRYLRKHGYFIVSANYSCRLGEIDLIAEDKKTNGQFFPADFKYFIHSSSIYGRELIFKTLNDYLMDKQT